MIHPFFEESKKYLNFINEIDFDKTSLPEPYLGKNQIVAILLGADPTNNGIKTAKGLKQLNTVFGIESRYEVDFFKPQLINLRALTLNKDDLFIQNLCRNYFTRQTGQNPKWNKIAELWIKYFKNEIGRFENIPILVTAEKILRVLTMKNIKAELLYEEPETHLPLWSDSLQREVYPLYRHPKYFLTQQNKYRDYLNTKLK